MSEDTEFLYKVVVIGDASIISRFANDEFTAILANTIEGKDLTWNGMKTVAEYLLSLSKTCCIFTLLWEARTV